MDHEHNMDMNMDMNIDMDNNALRTTLHGLECWTTAEFKKLGWMVLAKRNGNDYKISAYLKTLDELIKNLKARMEITQETDRKLNLHILKHNVWCLRSVAEVLLNSDMIPDICKKTKGSNKTHKSTKRQSTKRKSTKRQTISRSLSSLF